MADRIVVSLRTPDAITVSVPGTLLTPVSVSAVTPTGAAEIIPGPVGPAGRDGVDPGIMSFFAGGEIGGQRVVGLGSNGLAIIASSDDLDHFERVLGITEHGAHLDAPIAVRRVGEMTDPTWSFSVGPVWLGSDGTLTQTPPAVGFLQQVAFADQPTRLFVNVGDPVQINPTT